VNDRDYISIRGLGVRHTTACRDYVCGECGGRLVTRCLAGQWVTMCAENGSHDPDEFIHKTSWAWREHERMKEAAQAQDVFDHLPAELQAVLKGDERCP
jgi:hypothetical protein